MKVLVVYAHPNPQSFNHAILESFTKGLTETRHTYEVIDLYAIKFNPCLSGEDFVKLMEGKVSDDLKAHQEKVSQAEGIVFIHPIWWVGPPAILKGWIDRVFSMGFAYYLDEKEGKVKGLLKNQKALVINTAGGMEEDAKMMGSTDALKKIEDDLMFRFCGINDVQHVIFHNVVLADDATRKAYLEDARNLGKSF
jgi:NAD(P)H dehydrogenase (quinone)